MRFLPCNHLFVDGFGGMGDALVCIHCGLDRYPEAMPVAVAAAAIQRRIIRENHPEWNRYADLAREARRKRKGEA